MTIKHELEIISDYRDILHNLDRNNPHHQKIYERIRFEFLVMNEGIKHEAYKDHEGNITIGIGFNMDDEVARDEFNEAFDNKINFDDVKNGKRKLSDSEIVQLYEESIKRRNEFLSSSYKIIFDKLKYNELLALEDLYFNGPKLVGNKTNFYTNMHFYYETNEEKYLKQAIDEVIHRSNPTKHKGVQNRRAKQAKMIDSTNCPFYAKPDSKLLPFKYSNLTL